MSSHAYIEGGPQGKFFFRVDPTAINWSYKLNTSEEQTYGGKVIQLLGVSLGTLSISLESGSGRREELRRVLYYFKDLALWQKGTGRTVKFYYPPRKYSLRVVFKSVNFTDNLQNVTFPYQLNFLVEEDLNGLITKKTLSAELNKIADGIGYIKSIYNDPALSPITPPTAREGSGGGPAPDNTANSSLASVFTSICLSQKGKPYIWGAEANTSDSDPDAFDCSELVEWALGRMGISFPDGSQNQRSYIKSRGQKISVAQAARTPGALVFNNVHVAVSLGNGKTIEAVGRAYGVREMNIIGRSNPFIDGGLIPGITY
jgi:hypothetical protein